MSTSLAAQHSEWLSLVEISGPFLTLPVLKRALPLGLDPTPLPLVDDLRVAWSEVSDDDSLIPRWIRWVLHDLLELSDEVVKEGTEIGPALTYTVPEHGVRLRPDFAIVDPDPASGGPPARMLVATLPAGTKLDERLIESKWSADAVDRMAELCRGSGVRLGLVTNGDQWAVVDAPVGGATGVATWDASLWLEERLTLDAFTTLLGVRRFFSVADSDTLEAMLDESANAEAEVTDQLGKQVRAAVELLVDAMSSANRDRGGHLFDDISFAEVYAAAVTVMMRLVFLLSAEERGLFLLGDEIYDSTYAVSTLRAQLEEEANTYGEEVIARRVDAWHRLLATFRMVFGGARHENLRLPAYGGSLFDPDRFPFLEGRKTGELWRLTASNPLPIDNRTMLHILGALQILTFTDRRGVKEARRLSFRALDVEQIGHVYEGLLDHSAVRVAEVAVGLRGTNEPEIALELIETEAERGSDQLLAYLVELTGLSTKAVEKALAAEPDAHDLERLTSACDNDPTVADRIAPYLGLLRLDLAELPVVYLPDSIYVTQSSDRRTSGTYYTPRNLAEEMVRFALEPLVYRPGPAEGEPPEQWKLRLSSDLLDLRVCDLAMGSGAFLVAACRYLSGRLLEAWTFEAVSPGDPVGPTGGAAVPLPDDENDREILARRLVADRCLYGVDRNPMAVEMAKLSLWLVTLAKDRPFSFVDHALRTGDSLLGITSLAQLEYLHLDNAKGAALHGGMLFDPTAVITPLVDDAVRKRRELESFLVLDVLDAAAKRRLFEEARADLEQLRVVGDIVVGAALSTATQSQEALERRLVGVAPDVRRALGPVQPEGEQAVGIEDLRLRAEYWLDEGRPPMAPDRECLHWPLEFPEVFLDRDRPGFDAVVGNPPFQGGKRISRPNGTTYREHLVNAIADGRTGNADLVTYFFLRAAQLVRWDGSVALLATNSIAQGDSREVGMDWLTANNWSISRAVKSRPWPGDANLEVSQVWLHRGTWRGTTTLDGRPVSEITSSLELASRASGTVHRLQAPKVSFQGSILATEGFILTRQQAKTLISADARNAQVVMPYLNGEDLNSSPDCTASRWVINFRDWPREVAEQYPACFELLSQRVRQQIQDKPASYRGWANRWWQFWNIRNELYATIEGMKRILAIARVSKYLTFSFVSTRQVLNERLVVLAYDDTHHFGLLTSDVHVLWALSHSTTHETRPTYFPSDCFETFPQPELTESVGNAGAALDAHRCQLLLDRCEGLTATYNRVHDSKEDGADIVKLRRFHVELDHTIASAYGWKDLRLDHDFWETRQGMRFTVGPEARIELLDRLLELNHTRHAEEMRLGLHSEKGRRGSARKAAHQPSSSSPALFEVDP